MTLSRIVLLALVALLLTACATNGPIVGAGAAAVVAVFDQLLADGQIDASQYQAMVGGITSLSTSVEAVQKAQAGSLTTGEAATAAGGLAASVLGAIRVWRGPSDKGLLAKKVG
jgi:hypothetical protein